MSESARRPYESPLRVDQARRTRRAVVHAAATLFTEAGYGQTTVDEIAAAAGVSRKTAFAVGGKVDLLRLALDWATTGDDENTPLSAREQLTALAAQTDPNTLVRGWAQLTTDISARLSGLSMALTVAAGVDPEAKALQKQAQSQRLTGSRAFVRHLANHTPLREGLTTSAATDIVWLFADPSWHHRLVTLRAWSTTRFRTWLETTVRDQLLEHQ